MRNIKVVILGILVFVISLWWNFWGFFSQFSSQFSSKFSSSFVSSSSFWGLFEKSISSFSIFSSSVSPIFSFSDFSFNKVYAQSTSTITKTEADAMYAKKDQWVSDIVQYMNAFLKFIYIIIWPLLVLAGLSVDNTLVYWEVFHLDAVLWQVWNVMRNFANFALVFIAFYHIFKWLLKSDIKKIQDVVKNMLLAGILIQASWFLMGAVIDISTITVIWVGALPGLDLSSKSAQEQQNIVLNTPMLGRKMLLIRHPNTSEQSFTWYEYGDKKIASCYTIEGTDNLPYIVGRKLFSPDGNPLPTDFYAGVCSDGRDVYRYNDRLEKANKDTEIKKYKESIDLVFSNDIRTWDIKKWWAVLMNWEPAMEKIKDWTGFIYKPVTTCWDWSESCGVVAYTDTGFYNWGLTLGKILQGSKGYVGPFVTLYSSLLGFSDMNYWDKDKKVTSFNWAVFTDFLFKTIFSILLIVPLFTMVIVLVLRVGVLRLAIIFLPFLVLKWVFFNDSWGWEAMKWVDEYFKLWKLVGIIFAPVVMVFALALSLIFMTAIRSNNITDSINNSEMGLEITTKWECTSYIDIFGLVSICDKWYISKGKNLFADIIEKMFALGVMWFLLFAAIKTNAIGEKIWGKIQGLSEKLLGAAPIIPIPWSWWWVWFSTVADQITWNKISGIIDRKRNDRDLALLQDTAPSFYGKHKFLENWDDNLKRNIAFSIADGKSSSDILKKYKTELNQNSIFTQDNIEKYINNLQKNYTKTGDLEKKVFEAMGKWESFDEVMMNPNNIVAATKTMFEQKNKNIRINQQQKEVYLMQILRKIAQDPDINVSLSLVTNFIDLDDKRDLASITTKVDELTDTIKKEKYEKILKEIKEELGEAKKINQPQQST